MTQFPVLVSRWDQLQRRKAPDRVRGRRENTQVPALRRDLFELEVALRQARGGVIRRA